MNQENFTCVKYNGTFIKELTDEAAIEEYNLSLWNISTLEDHKKIKSACT